MDRGQFNSAKELAHNHLFFLSDHIVEWGKALTAKGNTPEHVRVRTQRVEKVFKKCGFVYWQDITTGDVESALEVLRAGKDSIRP